MRAIGVAVVAVMAASLAPAWTQTRIGSINTNFRWLGPDDKVVVERYDDPKIANVSCYLTRAETGGVKGAIGVAEDPSRFSIACRATGPVKLPADLPKSEVVAFTSSSFLFKELKVHRMVDADKHMLVYTVVSTKLIKGSPYNSVSAVFADGG